MDKPGRVVVGVDNTLSGLQALRHAVAEARARGAELHAVRAWSGGNELREDAVRVVIDAFADSVGRVPTEVSVTPAVELDVPGRALVGYACRDDDLLVVGARRRQWWRRWLWLRRSVARYCVARATCPVLVVPPPPLARGRSPRDLLRELRRDLDQLAEAE